MILPLKKISLSFALKAPNLKTAAHLKTSPPTKKQRNHTAIGSWRKLPSLNVYVMVIF